MVIMTNIKRCFLFAVSGILLWVGCINTSIAQTLLADEEMVSLNDDKAIQRQVEILCPVFDSVARAIDGFSSTKSYYRDNPDRLREELKKLTYPLEILRNNQGKTICSAAEKQAIHILMSDSLLSEYAIVVCELWRQTEFSCPLNVSYIAKLVAPEMLPYLDDVYVEEKESNTLISFFVVLLILMVGITVWWLYKEKRKKRLQEEELRKKEEEEKLRQEEEQKRLEEENRRLEEESIPQMQELENTNGYRIPKGEYAMSTDLDRTVFSLALPEKKDLEEHFILKVMEENGRLTQRFNLSKRVISFGRSGAVREEGGADIVFECEDRSISRFHGVLIYWEHRDDEENCNDREDSYWLLCVNQKSELNLGVEGIQQSSARMPWIKKNGKVQKGMALYVHPGDVVNLSGQLAIQIDKGE